MYEITKMVNYTILFAFVKVLYSSIFKVANTQISNDSNNLPVMNQINDHSASYLSFKTSVNGFQLYILTYL